MKELMNSITLSEVKNKLVTLKLNEDQVEFINGTVFESQVLGYANELNMSVNEIVGYYKNNVFFIK